MLFQLRECYVDERFPFAERDAAGGFTQHAGKVHFGVRPGRNLHDKDTVLAQELVDAFREVQQLGST